MKEGWRTLKLRDVCRLVNGRAYSKPELLSKGRYRVLRVGNFFTNNHWYFSDLELDEDKYCTAGDLLYAWSASFGPRVWTGEKVVFHYHIWKVVPNPDLIDQRFLFMFLLWDTELIKQDQGTGTTMIHVAKGSMEDRNIGLPSVAEQQRIVDILDEAFEGIATAKANAEKNLQNARDVFTSELEAVLSRHDADWKETGLGSHVDLLAGFAFKSAAYSDSSEDVKLLGGDNIIPGELRWQGVRRWPASDTPQYVRYKLRANDLVLAMDRPWVKAGLKHAMVPPSDLPCLLLQRTARLRAQANLEQTYLFYLIKTASFTRHILGTQTGSGVPHISATQISDFRFWLPPISEQRLIAKRLGSLSESVLRLESIYGQKLTALDELKKSLLHRAFTGAL